MKTKKKQKCSPKQQLDEFGLCGGSVFPVIRLNGGFQFYIFQNSFAGFFVSLFWLENKILSIFIISNISSKPSNRFIQNRRRLYPPFYSL